MYANSTYNNFIEHKEIHMGQFRIELIQMDSVKDSLQKKL